MNNNKTIADDVKIDHHFNNYFENMSKIHTWNNW